MIMEAKMEMAELEAPATPATADGEENQHAWPYLREMLNYVGVKNSSF